jgi:hypothetical protein
MALLPVTRYDIALGRVENPLNDPVFPLEPKKIKTLFDWVKEHVDQETKRTFRSSRYSMSVMSVMAEDPV